jgi:hypothetical protein
MAKFINVTTTYEVVPITYPTNSTSSTRLFVYQTMPIVTAAVYRGFDQELRLAADPIN